MQEHITFDTFLGKKVTIRQPLKGYRAGIDPVLLAAACPAQNGENVLELGAGVGVAALCLAHRSKAEVLGVEIQPFYCELAKINAQENDLPVSFVRGDVLSLSSDITARSFDHVIVNPPYFEAEDGTPSVFSGRETANRMAGGIAPWLDVATRRLRPGGVLTLINRATYLQEILTAIDGRLGALEILPLAPRSGRPAHRVLIRAKKGSRGALTLYSTRILHQGAAHQADKSDYTQEFQDILRMGAALNFKS